MTAPLETLISILDLETIDIDIYRGRSTHHALPRVFGGQVIGQSLVAAGRTVPADRPVHSLHAYFLRPGDQSVPILYSVDRIRDGGSFTTRRVVASQKGEPIFSLAASFHVEEPGPEFQITGPVVPPPEACVSEPDFRDRVVRHLAESHSIFEGFWREDWPFEIRPVDPDAFMTPGARPPELKAWIRVRHPLPPVRALHSECLAYISDMLLLLTARLPMPTPMLDPGIMMVSLDHAMWFHGPVKADEWLLYSCDAPRLTGARGLCRGMFFDRRGVLVASDAQEGLLRPLRPRG
ncbi:acyl-CoA thioesterase [Segnochrobactraceae bacterium EtOH-i3]